MLDKNKPHGEVFGMGQTRYCQDGKYYRLDGKEIVSEDVTTEEPGEFPYVLPSNLAHAKNDDLKLAMEHNGFDWVSRNDAIKTLKAIHG